LNNQITVNKVGGSGYVNNVTWTVDDPSVVQVAGSGMTAYFTAKKAGQALVTVAEAEAAPLEIRVIVRAAKAGSEYIATDDPIIMMLPSGDSRQVKVDLVGGTEQDIKNFEWEIYDQSPSNVSVAQSGGTVISLYANGNDGVVTSMYPGRARIRVKHPKANERLFIIVLVTQYNNLSFSDTEKTMLRGDHEFVLLGIPDYENMAGRLQVTTSDPNIVTVARAGNMVLLSASAGNTGEAVITARVQNTDLTAQLSVTVQAGIPDDVYIALSDTIITFSPYSPGKMISGRLEGDGLTASDMGSLKWEILDNYGEPTGTVRTTKSLLTFPQAVTTTVSGKKIDTFYGGGAQIYPNANVDFSTPQYVTIRVSNTKGGVIKTKNILVHISEPGNRFTFNKAEVRFEPGKFETVEATIAGGAARDYEEIEWYLERDFYNPYKEVARVMGSGKSVQVFGIADGEVELVAVYRGEIKKCAVIVESPQYFEINYELWRMYPGEESLDESGNRKGDGFFRIPFTVRPVDANVRWYDNDDKVNPKITWYHRYPFDLSRDNAPELDEYKWKYPKDCIVTGHFENGAHTGGRIMLDDTANGVVKCSLPPGAAENALKEPNTGYLYVKPLKEGNVIITGNYGHFVSSVDVVIEYNSTVYFTPMRLPEEILQMGSSSRTGKKDKAALTANYSMFPPNTYLKLEDSASWEQRGVQAVIGNLDKTTGKGAVVINCYQEVYNLDKKSSEKYATLTFAQYVREDGVEKETGRKAELKILVMYRTGEQRIIPVFQRVYGTYGNRAAIGSDGSVAANTPYKGNTDGNNYYRSNRLIKGNDLRDPFTCTVAGHDGTTCTSANNIYCENGYPTTGGLYNAGEWLRQTDKNKHADGNNNNMQGGDSDTYDLVIGDGEEHYIMFDPAVSNMDYEIESVDVASINTKTENNGNRGVTAEVVKDEKGKIAGVRLSGGKDFVVYSNAGSMYDIEIDIECEKPNTGEGWRLKDAFNWKQGNDPANPATYRYQNVTNFLDREYPGQDYAEIAYITDAQNEHLITDYVWGDKVLTAIVGKTNNVPEGAMTAPPFHASYTSSWTSCTGMGFAPAGTWNCKDEEGNVYYPEYGLLAHGTVKVREYDWGPVLTKEKEKHTVWRPLLKNYGLNYEFGGDVSGIEGPIDEKIILVAEDKVVSSGRFTVDNRKPFDKVVNFLTDLNWGIAHNSKITMGGYGFKAYVGDTDKQIRRYIEHSPAEVAGDGKGSYNWQSGEYKPFDNYTFNLNSYDYVLYSAEGALKLVNFVNFMEGLVFEWENGEGDATTGLDEESGVILTRNNVRGSGKGIQPVNKVETFHTVTFPNNQYARATYSDSIKRGGALDGANTGTARKGLLPIGNGQKNAAVLAVKKNETSGGYQTAPVYNEMIKIKEITGNDYFQEKEEIAALEFTFHGFKKNDYGKKDFFPVIDIDSLSEFPFGYKINLNHGDIPFNDAKFDHKKYKKFIPLDYENLKFTDDLFVTGISPDEWEVIKGTHVFFPVSTQKPGVVKVERDYGRIVVKYNTARGPKYVNIDIHYEVRGTTAGFVPNSDSNYIKAPSYGDFNGTDRSEYLRKIDAKGLLNEYNIRLNKNYWTETRESVFSSLRIPDNEVNIGIEGIVEQEDSEGCYKIDVDY
jgi:hypothetical protein